MNNTPIVDPHGRPARQVLDTRCPGCGVDCPEGDKAKRVASCGFGQPHDVCRKCGWEFEGLTV